MLFHDVLTGLRPPNEMAITSFSRWPSRSICSAIDSGVPLPPGGAIRKFYTVATYAAPPLFKLFVAWQHHMLAAAAFSPSASNKRLLRGKKHR